MVRVLPTRKARMKEEEEEEKEYKVKKKQKEEVEDKVKKKEKEEEWASQVPVGSHRTCSYTRSQVHR